MVWKYFPKALDWELPVDGPKTLSGLVIDQEAYRVTVDGSSISLTFKEFELLRYLVAKRGRVLADHATRADREAKP